MRMTFDNREVLWSKLQHSRKKIWSGLWWFVLSVSDNDQIARVCVSKRNRAYELKRDVGGRF